MRRTSNTSAGSRASAVTVNVNEPLSTSTFIQRTSFKSKKHSLLFTLYTNSTVCRAISIAVVITVAVWALCSRSNVHVRNDDGNDAVTVTSQRHVHCPWNRTELEELPTTPSLFDRCSDPTTTTTTSRSPCVYFHPTQFFAPSNPGYPYRHLLDIPTVQANRPNPAEDANAASNPPISLTVKFHQQVNNWPAEQPGSVLVQRPYPQRLYPHELTSVTLLSCPKAASRTLYELFLQALSRTKMVREAHSRTVPRVGEVTPEHVRELSRRQSQRLQMENCRKDESTKAMPLPSVTRLDVAFTILRDPIPRFISSISELLNLYGTQRCIGCEFIRPCLKGNTVSESFNARYIDDSVDVAVDFLSCVVSMMTTTTTTATTTGVTHTKTNHYFNEHMLPSAFFLTEPLNHQSIELAVFPMNKHSIQQITREFGVEDLHLNSVGTKTRMETQFMGWTEVSKHLLKIMEYVDQNVYSQNSSLTGKVQRLMTAVCELYRVDVVIMQHLGFPMMHCT